MHPIEQAFQVWAKIEMPLIGDVESLRASHYAVSEDPIPENVVVPRAAIVAHIRRRIEKATKLGFTAKVTDEMSVHRASDNAATWFAYREDKSIFVPTKEILEALLTCPSPMDIPLNSLTLPRRCCFFDLSALAELDPTAFAEEFHRTPYVAVFNDLRFGSDVVEFDIKDRQIPSLTACRMATTPKSYKAPAGYAAMEPMFTVPTQLVGGTLESSLRLLLLNRYTRTMQELQKLGKGQPVELPERLHYLRDLAEGRLSFAEYYPAIPIIVNLLLYINGEPDIVAHVHPGERPQGVSPSKWNYKKKIAPPTVTPVGEKFTAAIQRWEIERKREYPKGEGGSKRPHYRKPHPHRYWVGEKDSPDRRVVIRHLGFVSVHDFPIPVEAATVSITPVK